MPGDGRVRDVLEGLLCISCSYRRRDRALRVCCSSFRLLWLRLVPLASLQHLEMARLLGEKLLSLSNEPRAALLLDLVLRDDGRFLRLDYAGAAASPSSLPWEKSAMFTKSRKTQGRTYFFGATGLGLVLVAP